MKRKIAVAAMIFVLFLAAMPLKQASAAETPRSLLQGVPLSIYSKSNNSFVGYTSALSDLVSTTTYTITQNNVVHVFNEAVTITDVFVNMSGTTLDNFTFYFYSDSERKNLIRSYSPSGNNRYIPITPVTGVKSLMFNYKSTNGFTMRDIDVKGYESERVRTEQTNTQVTDITDRSVKVSWANPVGFSRTTFKGVKLYLNGSVIWTGSPTDTSKVIEGLNQNTTYNIKAVSVYEDDEGTTETAGVTKDFQTLESPEITSFTQSKNYQSIKLNWNFTSNPYIDGVNIYKDGSLIKKVAAATKSYTDTRLKPETEYQYEIRLSLSTGGEIDSKKETVKTEKIELIKNVDVETKYNRVNLSWTLPEQEGFKHVNIYRSEKEEEPGFFQSLFMGAIVAAAEEDQKIFETNGTYFNDLTVKPETEYEYTLSTQTIEGYESEQITVEALTKEEPTPILDGAAFTRQPNGDYKVSWSSPTVGKVKILMDGKEYKIVAASQLSYTVPAKDIKNSVLGNALLSVQPIGEYGKLGDRVSNTSAIETPFGVGDLVGSGMSLFLLVSPFVLLALSFLLFPKFRKLILSSFGGSEKEKEKQIIQVSRRSEKEIHEGKEHLEQRERIEKERITKERLEQERLLKDITRNEIRSLREREIPPRERQEKTLRRTKGLTFQRAQREQREPRERTRGERINRTRRGE